MTEYALRLENGTDTWPRVRLGDTLGLAHNGPLTAVGGLRPDGGGVVAVSAGTMQVTVTPFLAWIDGAASLVQGGYPFALDATKTLTLADGDAALARTDTICARVRDNAFDASGVTAADVFVLQGTPGAGAAVVPGGCEALRDVIVPAGASLGAGGLSSGALSTDRRRYTSGLGGIVPVSGTAQRDALTVTSNGGRAVWRYDTKTLEVYDGTSWQTVPLGSSGGDTWHTVGAAGEPAYGGTWGANAGWTVDYTKNSAGMVSMRGLAKGGAAASRIFTLPAGYRPTKLITLPSMTLNGTVRVDVGTDGQVIPRAAATSFSTSDWVNLTLTFTTA